MGIISRRMVMGMINAREIDELNLEVNSLELINEMNRNICSVLEVLDVEKNILLNNCSYAL